MVHGNDAPGLPSLSASGFFFIVKFDSAQQAPVDWLTIVRTGSSGPVILHKFALLLMLERLQKLMAMRIAHAHCPL